MFPLKIISSCIRTVSTNATTVASTVRSAGESVAASIASAAASATDDHKDQVSIILSAFSTPSVIHFVFSLFKDCLTGVSFPCLSNTLFFYTNFVFVSCRYYNLLSPSNCLSSEAKPG